MRGKPASAILDPNGDELALFEVGEIDIEGEDVSRVHGAREAAIVGCGFHVLAIDFEKHHTSLDTGVER
jgi:hypothetical protein